MFFFILNTKNWKSMSEKMRKFQGFWAFLGLSEPCTVFPGIYSKKITKMNSFTLLESPQGSFSEKKYF